MTVAFSAILLAAGEGKRLRPLTNSIPKCLVPINGIPLLDLWIKLLAKQKGLQRILINTSYLAEKVKQYIADHENRDILYLYHEPKLLGTAGTLKLLGPELSCDHVFIAHADNLTLFDMEQFFYSHLKKPKGCEITMMTFKASDPQSCGIVELDEDGVVVAYIEKPKRCIAGDANAAVYFVNQSVIQKISTVQNAFDLSRDIIPLFVGKIFAWKNTIYHRDIGTPESYKKAQSEYIKISNSERDNR